MAIVKWNPGRDLVRAQDEFSRIFDNFFGNYDDQDWFDGAWLPATDISENDNAIELKAELPGLKKEDIKISVYENVLSIQGEKKESSKTDKKNYHRIERSYGSFHRRFSLPAKVKGDQIKAEYKEGVLTLTIPKAEEVKPKQIEVNVE